MSMQPFVTETGVCAALMRNNIDTDQITPGHTGMKVQKTGFGEGLFFNWRYLPDGGDNPDFVLNQGPFRDAKFLLAGANFGCGSSREFAVWALRDFGIRAVIAPSFGAIFTSNCYMNGVAPIILDEAAVSAIAGEIAPDHCTMTVDLVRQVILSPGGREHRFHIPDLQRERLVEGLDAIDATRKRDDQIAAFQAADRLRRPWVYAVEGAAA
ncbi:3-isopropylmalate dehydratase, small subunit [Rhizorhabdus wittichii RW1]|uniref:3-isopropylmalate dehydratase small subunit n=2 Tax=Rhizorhabdus wittichii TaxID=160791 RepID=A0A9J9HFD1_RHIWR|nr:3-isopropylmalate dehydratase small subunit [Rhizorhabdus wittichii]ABQ70666.1 3-isopropylmalate dehydratase, small subunit [Rhizorhabdus wittichii RW1]QTH23821.1 3-isopropylmalate dehydratase small subunit [Rhizorhabdus wittichii]